MVRGNPKRTGNWGKQAWGKSPGWKRPTCDTRHDDATLVCSSPVKLIALASVPGESSGGGDNWREVVLIGDGITEMVNGETVLLDAEGAAEIIKNVNHAGVDLPFDLDHSTQYQAPEGKPAPAMGWVDHKSIRYEAGRGLIGRVDWNDEGAGYLHNKSYRYHSPVMTFNKKTRRVRILHHLALTNVPLTRNARPLAASQTRSKSYA